MFVKAQNEKRFINLANVTDVYSERKTEGGKQKYVLYFDKIPAGSFSKQESIDKVLTMLESKVQAKQRMEIIDGEPPKIIYYQDQVFQIQARMNWYEETIICKRQSI